MIVLPEEFAKKHLQTSYCKGDVLFWENFSGKERLRDSYLVLLTNCINDKFIFVRATAQTQHYSGPLAKRIAHDIVFIKAGETPIFPKNTVLDLNWMDYLSVDKLCKLLGLSVKKEGRLSPNIIKRIDDCVRSALTVSPRNQKLILQSKYQAFTDNNF